MELKVIPGVNANGNLALGVSNERYQELMDKLSKMPPGLPTLTDRQAYTASVCDNLEEYTICITQDLRYLIFTGQITAELVDEKQAEVNDKFKTLLDQVFKTK